MKKIITLFSILIFSLASISAIAAPQRYGQKLCKANSNFFCYKVKPGDSWKKLFPNSTDRDVIQRVNRINLRLRSGWIIAIPKSLGEIDHFSVSPFKLQRDPTGQKTVIVDLNELAWGAYDEQGRLVHWGPASGGKGWCGDVNKPCRTQTGNYSIYSKKPYHCISNKFPLPYGGAAMPYCMHYHKAFALHGSYEVPGYNASHGCIRMFITDARWLNQMFSDYNTKVIVKAYQP